MKDKILNPEIEELLQSKAFLELSLSEKELVSSVLSKEEYIHFRNILKTATDSLKDEIEIPDLKAKLMSSYNKQHPKSTINKIAHYALPLYQVAAILIVVLGLFAIIGQEVIIGNDSNKVYVYLTDTIYKEVLVPDKIWLADSSTRNSFYDYKDDVAFVGEPKSLHLPAEKNSNNQLSNEEAYHLAKRSGIIPEIDITATSRRNGGGRSLQEDSIWRKYMVVNF